MTGHALGSKETKTSLKVSACLMLLLVAGGCSKSESGATPATGDVAAAGSDTPAKKANPKHPVVRVETSVGSIVLRLDAVRAPATVRNFLNLVSERFYDNTIVHYVDAGKMIVAGGYSTDRTVKPALATIRNEAHNGLKNVRGSVAMARDPGRVDSATSHFFINLADAPHRDHRGESAEEYGYCVFGEVVEGIDVAERIAESSTTDLGGELAQTPEPAVVVTSVRLD